MLFVWRYLSMLFVVLAFVGLSGCALSPGRYVELRRIEECRIFGPSCARAYASEQACLSDLEGQDVPLELDDFDPESALLCIDALRQMCPVRSSTFAEPEECASVFRDTE